METSLKRTTKEDQRIAFASISKIDQSKIRISKFKKNSVQIKIKESDEFLTIPKKALNLLFEILSNMAKGKSVTLIPSETEISTQQAADILNISRPHLVKILENGIIPFSKVGKHRRIKLQDLIHFEKELKLERKKSLEFLAKQAQELNLGYE